MYFVFVALVLLAPARPDANHASAAGLANPSVGGPASAPDSTPVATVSGTVKVIGTLPKPTPINMGQEPVCAKQHGGSTTVAEVVAGPNGTLSNVVVYVSEGFGDKVFEPPAQPAVIDQNGCVYSPHIIAVQTNQKLKVVNSDPTMHNIHPIPANNREWNKSQPPSTPPIETSFAREEVAIPVKCNVHPWMKSYIAVIKNPFFAVTGKEGGFELKNLPPGNYTITAWHEKLGLSEQKITVAPNESKKLEFVFKSRG
jgi:hypothetical protein